LIAIEAIPRSSLVTSHTWLEALRSDRVMLSRSSSLLRPPPTSARHFAVSQVRWLSVSMLPGTTGLAARGLSMPGVETDLSSSKDTLLTIPRPLRREVLRHPLQDPWCRPWPSPTGDGLGSSSSVRTRTGVTTLQASLDVADWSVARPRFAPGLSTTHGSFATGDLGVSPDRTRTGWLPSACRLVTSSQHKPPCCHGAQSPGRTPSSPG
jgi:hypothetical protein